MDRSAIHRRLRLTPRSLAIVAVAMALSDLISVIAGDSFLPGGPVDEVAHLLTTLLVLWAFGPRIYERFLIPALIISVAIDIDHIPDRLGFHFLNAHAPRPYTHSLLTIVVVLVGAAAWRSRRDVSLGLALGLAIHFWRDLADSGSSMSLFWPFTYARYSIPHASYALVLAAVVAIDAYRCRGQSGARSSRRGALAEGARP